MSEKFPNSGPQEETNPRDAERKLDWALQRGSIPELEKLFDGGMDIDQTDFEGRTALELLTARGNKVGVEMMLARGADVNKIFMFQGRKPMTALDAAEQAKQIEIEEILKAHGAKTGREITS